LNRINEINNLDLKGKPIIQSFSGSGAIGTILSTFLVKALKMEQVAVIHAEDLPPVAIIKDGLIEQPIRIFQNDQIALMSCEVSIPYNTVPDFIEMLVDFYIKNEVSYIVPVGGLPSIMSPYEEISCFGIASNKETLSFLEEKEIHLLEEGVIYGTVVQTLELCSTKGFDSNFALLVECDPNTASYDSTKILVQNLAKIFDFEFDEEEFDNVTNIIQSRILESTRIFREDTMDKTRESHL
jgi:predicted ATP-grasp superfamily ATP-dependent carboligase